ncbi:GntR family transcriptional regulator [Fulvivirgaceae bacterium BMA10]|uniref:GntR family transcriptional regulator n=1 Tax=Splendidivirga corallicola TaxID=3051826 RepID=A0ABT8KR27_9BACT|nr:GntR family transcriptional regulator [Fulvivirgaceae bacterium BMA10]
MIQKITLRDQVRKYLQQEMLDRNITFGERISLAEIARKIEVSVTPIREALTQLEQAGIVSMIANRGFFVPELTIREANEIYPIIMNLECMGLMQSEYASSDFKDLMQIQSDFRNANNKEEAVKQDLHFHETLLRNYQNDTAKRILTDLKIRVFFYELEYMNHHGNIEKSAVAHDDLMKSLKRKDIQQALNLLKENWEVSLKFLCDHSRISVG